MAEITIMGSADNGDQSVSIDGVKLPAVSCEIDVSTGRAPKVVVTFWAHTLNAFLKDADLKLVVKDRETGEQIELETVELASIGV